MRPASSSPPCTAESSSIRSRWPAAGNRPLFPPDRQIEDHVSCIFEFPAPGYDPKDPIAAQKKIGVQYASINGNGFGGYGETVLGTEGTLILEAEQDVMLYKVADTAGKTKVLGGQEEGRADRQPTLELYEEGDEESAAIARLAMLQADRGYAEELEDWAWCIRNRDPKHLPRCHPAVALGDAVIALVANKAIRQQRRYEFEPRVVRSRPAGNARGRHARPRQVQVLEPAEQQAGDCPNFRATKMGLSPWKLTCHN